MDGPHQQNIRGARPSLLSRAPRIVASGVVGISFVLEQDILFQISLSVLLATCHLCAPILLETSALYKSFTYLLAFVIFCVDVSHFSADDGSP